jgi:Ni/Fe-hydrogenase subunit HybB-like protein
MAAASLSRRGYLPAETSYRSITVEVALVPFRFPVGIWWYALLGASGLLVVVFLVSVAWLFWFGVGVWGNQTPVYWGLAITNYVWWISMAHAGTLISALLLIMNRGWRNTLNRFAEAMTVFAVMMAGLYPVLHLGRAWLLYYLFPYPSTFGVWPQFKSPLLWDVAAVLTYLIVSVLFWYIGLIPDLATLRDRARWRPAQLFYGLLALGWRNSAIHWRRWQITYWTFAGLAVPLVASVETGVAMLFANGLVPGWHSTEFPPYFLLSAIYEGFATLILITVALRRSFALENLITDRHLDLLGRILLLTGLLASYGILADAYTAWFWGDGFERSTAAFEIAGAYAWAYWGAVIGNAVVIQLLWWGPVRRSVPALSLIAAVGVIGTWLDHFLLVEAPLAHDFLPSAWRVYTPSIWEWSLFAGTLGVFLFLFLLFVRVMPMMSMFELKELVHRAREP